MAMREIRTFELEYGESAAAWRVAQPLVLKVMAGQIWLTVEGDAEDYWLSSGDTFELSRGAVARVSAGQGGARMALAFASGSNAAQVRPATRAARKSLWSWVPRWLQTA
jgi:quercetin dioxygenase-like cupin family protein